MKTILHNGKVYLEKGVYAEAVLIENGTFGAVGTDDDVLAAAEAGGGDFERGSFGRENR